MDVRHWDLNQVWIKATTTRTWYVQTWIESARERAVRFIAYIYTDPKEWSVRLNMLSEAMQIIFLVTSLAAILPIATGMCVLNLVYFRYFLRNLTVDDWFVYDLKKKIFLESIIPSYSFVLLVSQVYPNWPNNPRLETKYSGSVIMNFLHQMKHRLRCVTAHATSWYP